MNIYTWLLNPFFIALDKIERTHLYKSREPIIPYTILYYLIKLYKCNCIIVKC